MRDVFPARSFRSSIVFVIALASGCFQPGPTRVEIGESGSDDSTGGGGDGHTSTLPDSGGDDDATASTGVPGTSDDTTPDPSTTTDGGSSEEGSTDTSSSSTSDSAEDSTTDDVGTTTGVPDCTPDPEGPIYVDPGEGTDDPSHGGGPGSCAVATLSYALERATGEIRHAAGTYALSAAIELGAGQRLVCPVDNSTTFQGQPAYATWHVAVRLIGTGSAVENCRFEGAGNNGYCLEVTTGSTSVSNVRLSNCGGAAIRTLASGATFTSNVIDNGNTHLFFQGGFSAVANDNTFIGTPTDNVSCSASSTITGSGNTGSQGCNANCNCPAGFFD